MSNLIESIREFILACPFLQDGRVNVDYIGEDMGYSIDPLPCDPIVQRYTDGGAKKQFQFAFTSQEEYDQDARINIENSGFFQAFAEWLEEQELYRKLPGAWRRERFRYHDGNFKQRLSVRRERRQGQSTV